MVKSTFFGGSVSENVVRGITSAAEKSAKPSEYISDN